MIVVGSPANHYPNNQRFSGESQSNNVVFKTEVLQQPRLAYRQRLLGLHDFLQERMRSDAVVDARARRQGLSQAAGVLGWFASYRPRLGRSGTLSNKDSADPDPANSSTREKVARFPMPAPGPPERLLEPLVWQVPNSEGKYLPIRRSWRRWRPTAAACHP